jgi:predicted RNA-binding Zn-ribbon protein involved in translation (DUF1610 family)
MALKLSISRAIVLLLKMPLYALYGAYALAAGYLRRMSRLGESARLLGTSLACPSCGEANPLDGRWKCRSCSATYHGAVFHCGFCGAGASFFSCRGCGISIALRRPR